MLQMGVAGKIWKTIAIILYIKFPNGGKDKGSNSVNFTHHPSTDFNSHTVRRWIEFCSLRF